MSNVSSVVYRALYLWELEDNKIEHYIITLLSQDFEKIKETLFILYTVEISVPSRENIPQPILGNSKFVTIRLSKKPLNIFSEY